jgi:hemerythrin-like domain-containing protein
VLSIGKRIPTERLVDLFLECHGRIRSFTRLAVAIAERGDAAPKAVTDACEQCARYFREALPLHVADEEASLMPRLMGRDVTVDVALRAMADQHRVHGADLQAMLDALDRVREDTDDPALRTVLLSCAQRLERAFAEHLDLEERTIFPLIDRLLSPSEQAQIVTELRARRRPQRDAEPKA